MIEWELQLSLLFRSEQILKLHKTVEKTTNTCDYIFLPNTITEFVLEIGRERQTFNQMSVNLLLIPVKTSRLQTYPNYHCDLKFWNTLNLKNTKTTTIYNDLYARVMVLSGKWHIRLSPPRYEIRQWQNFSSEQKPNSKPKTKKKRSYFFHLASDSGTLVKLTCPVWF